MKNAAVINNNNNNTNYYNAMLYCRVTTQYKY